MNTNRWIQCRTTSFATGLTACLVAVTALGAAACTIPPPAPAPPVIQVFRVAGEPFSDPALVPFVWRVTDVNHDHLTCRIDFDADATWDETVADCPTDGSRNFTPTLGTHSAILEVTDGTHPPRTSEIEYTVDSGPTEPFDIAFQSSTPFEPAVQTAFDAARTRFQSIVARGLPDAPVSLAAGSCGPEPFDGIVDDLVVNVEIAPIGGFSGEAGPCVFGPEGLPRFGIIRLNSDHLPQLVQQGLLEDLVLHELAHVLGFGILWQGRSLLLGAGTDDPRYIGPRAVAEYSALGGGGGVPVENLYAGQRDDHWRENAPEGLGTELMTPLIGAGAHPLSRITVGALGDLGYHVDPTMADPFALQAPASGARATDPEPVLDRVLTP